MKELFLNNKDNRLFNCSLQGTLIETKGEIEVYKVGENLYDVYYKGAKIDGRVRFPVKGDGCSRCIYADGACNFHRINGFSCTSMPVFGLNHNLTFIKSPRMRAKKSVIKK